MTPNGARIVAGTSDGLVNMIDGSNGDVLWSYRRPTRSPPSSIAADGQTVLAGSKDKHAYLLDGKGQLQRSFAFGDEVLASAISGDGSVLVMGTAGSRALIADRNAAQASYAASQSRSKIITGGTIFVVMAAVAVSAALLRADRAGPHGVAARPARRVPCSARCGASVSPT